MEIAKRMPLALVLFGLVVTTLVVWMSIPKTWKEAVKKRPDGSYDLSDEWASAIENKKEKIENQELYKLVAKGMACIFVNIAPIENFSFTKEKFIDMVQLVMGKMVVGTMDHGNLNINCIISSFLREMKLQLN